MADDDDTDREFDKPHPQAAVDAFYQALTAVKSECEQLDVAMQRRDPERAAQIAGAAVAFFIAAKAALRRFHMSSSTDLVLAHVAAGSAFRALFEQFLRTEAAIPAPALRQLLCRLRLSLVLSYGEPPRCQ